MMLYEKAKMEKKAGRRLVIAASILLAAGLVFLGLSIFAEPKLDWVLPMGLGCAAAANLLVAARRRKRK